MQQGFPSQRRRLVTVLMISTLVTGALCYPGTRSLYFIPGSSPKKSGRSHNGFNDQYNHNSHDKFTAFGQDGKGLILPEDFSGARYKSGGGLVDVFSIHPGLGFGSQKCSSFSPALRYYLFIRTMIAFDCTSKVSITQLLKIGTHCLELRLYPSDRSVNFD